MKCYTQRRTEYAEAITDLSGRLRLAIRQLTQPHASADGKAQVVDLLSQCRADLVELSECIRSSRRLPGYEEGPHPATSATPKRLAS